MLISVVTGTYSSIFVGAPILVDVAKDKPLTKLTRSQKQLKINSKDQHCFIA